MVFISLSNDKVITSTMMLGQKLDKTKDGNNIFWNKDNDNAEKQATLMSDTTEFLDADTIMPQGDVSQYYPTKDGASTTSQDIAYVITHIDYNGFGLSDLVFTFLTEVPYVNKNKTSYNWIDYIITTIILKSQGAFIEPNNVLATKTLYSIVDFDNDEDDNKSFTFPYSIIPRLPYEKINDKTFPININFEVEQNSEVNLSSKALISIVENKFPTKMKEIIKKFASIKYIDLDSKGTITDFKSLKNNFSTLKIEFSININDDFANGSQLAYQSPTFSPIEVVDIKSENVLVNANKKEINQDDTPQVLEIDLKQVDENNINENNAWQEQTIEWNFDPLTIDDFYNEITPIDEWQPNNTIGDDDITSNMQIENQGNKKTLISNWYVAEFPSTNKDYLSYQNGIKIGLLKEKWKNASYSFKDNTQEYGASSFLDNTKLDNLEKLGFKLIDNQTNKSIDLYCQYKPNVKSVFGYWYDTSFSSSIIASGGVSYTTNDVLNISKIDFNI